MSKKLMIASACATLVVTGVVHAQITQVPEGVRLKDGGVAQGAVLIPSYDARRPGASTKQDRAKNRAAVVRFFQLPIGMERAALFDADGVKQSPGTGAQWVGTEAQRKNNTQNQTLFPGWSWSNVVVWDTQDPTVFWVETDGHTAPGRTPAFANHYVDQFIVRNGKISLFHDSAHRWS